MLYIRGTLKLLFFLFAISLFILVSFTGQLFLRDPKKRRHFFTALASFVSKFGVWFLNVRVTVKNKPDPSKNYLFVGNHLGILDILLVASVHPTLFITSVEMRQTPGLGLFCEMGGCLFVERRSRSGIQKEIFQIREALQQGLCVTLYPEGTSNNGERVHPFKKSLITAAAGTGVPIKPMVVNYRTVNGEPMSDRWRDHVCWYGDQTFPPVLWRLLNLRACEAEIEFMEEIHVHSDEERRAAATEAQTQIEAKYTPIPKPDSVISMATSMRPKT